MSARRPRPRLGPWLLAGLTAWGAGVGGFFCGHAEPAPSPLKIGLVLPPGEPEAETIRRGAQLGAELLGAELGSPIELIVRGSPGQWGTEGDDAVALALDAGAQALLAPALGATVHLVEQVAGRTRIPTASLCGDTSVTGARIPWVLRLVPDNVQEARALFAGARAADGQPVRRWAALVPEDRAGREAAQDLAAAARAADCELDPVLSVATNPTNAAPTLERLLRPAPAGVLVWLDSVAAARWVRALRSAGFRGVLAGPGRLVGPTFLKGAGAAAEGFWATRPELPAAARPRADAFVAAFAARFGVEPDPLALAAADAVRVLATVLREADERPAFALMPPRRPLDGWTGPLEFDAVGNRRLTLEVVVARHGRFGRPADAAPTDSPAPPVR
jgi:ABC-type branched-subunit amino acid transport system substrate-binding protein